MTASNEPAMPGIWARLSSAVLDKRQITAAIEAAIRDGSLPAGERLPTERAIADASGLARNTVRDALARLVTFVVGPAPLAGAPGGTMPEPFGRSVPSPRELVEFRRECEPVLASLIVMNASDDELRAIEGVALAGRRASLWHDCETVDSEFHGLLYAATRNPVFQEIGRYMVSARRSQAWLSLKRQTFSLDRWQRYQAEHEQIVALLVHRDARQAQDALRGHLGRVQGWVADRSDPGQRPDQAPGDLVMDATTG
jgi:DNA-binding FadR family transcriptional regulator